jgi:O-antigen ligase
MTDASGSALDRVGFWSIAGSLAVVQFNLLTAQVLFGIAAMAWLVIVIREGAHQSWPAFAIPLGAYAVWTLLSAGASIQPLASFEDSRQLVLLLMVPIVMRFVRGPRAMAVVDIVMALGAAGALVGIVEFALLGYDNLSRRPEGLLSHYMTYSGILMLVTCAAASRLLFYAEKRIWPGVAVPALLVALAVTFTRNAWIGTAVGIAALLAVRSRRLLLVLPILIAAAFLVAPHGIRSRVTSMFDPHEDSNRDRLQMLAMGADMVRDHPVFGVGPEMVQRVYGQYLRPNPVHTYNPHLHNVPMQIAAERGLPALALWIWFVAVVLRDTGRQLRHGTAPAIAGAAFASVLAMLAAGLFEYNFGDSEFLMLFLGLVTLPYAAALSAPAAADRSFAA